MTIENNSVGKGSLTYRWSSSRPDLVSFDDPNTTSPILMASDNQASDEIVQITLDVASEDNCITSLVQDLTIFSRPTAQLERDPIQCLTDGAIFSNTSLNNSSAADSLFIWQFGDGNSDTLTTREEVTHFYSETGTYTVTLFVINDNSCADTTQNTIDIIDAPTPVIDFTIFPENACAPVEATFSSDSSRVFDLGETYFWDFGNGQTSVLPNPDPITFLQSDAGDTTYFVSLSITNECETVVTTESVTVTPTPIADFSVPFTFGCDGLAVEFFNESRGLPTLFMVDFGDGTQETFDSQEPFFHTFQNDGFEDITYPVTLTAINDCGSDTTTREITIVPFNDDVNISLLAADNSFCMGDSIQAVVAGLGGDDGREISWLVDNRTFLGEDSIGFVINEAGVFDLILTVNIRPCGSIVTDTLQLIIEPGPSINFDIPSSLCFGDTLEVDNNGDVRAENTFWDYGDGFTFQGSVPPNHVYDSAGTYTVTMSLAGANGCNSQISRNVDVGNFLDVDFEVVSNPLCTGATVELRNQSTGASSYLWTIDTLTQFTTVDAALSPFAEPGIYEITLEAFSELNQQGCSESITRSLTIFQNPEAGFDSPTSVCAGSLFSIINTSQFQGDSVLWTFGDGRESVEFQPDSLTYEEPGTYTISLMVVDPSGCSDRFSQQIEILTVPQASFVSQSLFCEDTLIVFDNTSVNAASYRWEIEERNDSSFTEDLSRIFTDPTNITVRMQAFADQGQQGCVNETSQQFVINPNPLPAFTLSAERICEDSLFTIDNTSQGAALFDWSLVSLESGIRTNVATTSDLSPFDFAVSDADSYAIRLLATSAQGCFQQASMPINVIANPIIDLEVFQEAFCQGVVIDLRNNTETPSAEEGLFTWFENDQLISNEFQLSRDETRFDRLRGVDQMVTYRLEVTNEICTDSVMVDQEVPGFFGCEAVMPNAFTPNGDGINDFFQVEVHSLDQANVLSVDIRIFTTTEQLIYERKISRSEVNGFMTCEGNCEGFSADNWAEHLRWDGSIGGQFFENDRAAYLYRVDVDCCEQSPRPYAGYVQLLR